MRERPKPGIFVSGFSIKVRTSCSPESNHRVFHISDKASMENARFHIECLDLNLFRRCATISSYDFGIFGFLFILSTVCVLYVGTYMSLRKSGGALLAMRTQSAIVFGSFLLYESHFKYAKSMKIIELYFYWFNCLRVLSRLS